MIVDQQTNHMSKIQVRIATYKFPF